AHGSDFGVPGVSGRSPSGDSVSENKPSLFRKNTLDEMTVRRTEKPVEGAKPVKSDDVKPVLREKVGIGSYEDAADTARQKRRPAKTGRPGR
ncbi:MAG TPA: hypothetical protein PKD01_14220, partial [Mesorhizobium sp.]|nr:hypothetical protein [Mesorhizobium sp.]